MTVSDRLRRAQATPSATSSHRRPDRATGLLPPAVAASLPAMPLDLTTDEYFMGEALRQARLAYENDEVPIGAVIVRDKKIIARAHNQVELLKDATAHAEMLALTQAAHALGDWRLDGCALYVTKEPCPMCAGALTLARVQRLVFGARDEKSGAAGTVFNIPGHGGLNHIVQVVAGFQEAEARDLLKSFFRERRAQPPAAEL